MSVKIRSIVFKIEGLGSSARVICDIDRNDMVVYLEAHYDQNFDKLLKILTNIENHKEEIKKLVDKIIGEEK